VGFVSLYALRESLRAYQVKIWRASVQREDFAQPAARPAFRLLSLSVGSWPNVLSGPEKFSGDLPPRARAWRDGAHLLARSPTSFESAFPELK